MVGRECWPSPQCPEAEQAGTPQWPMPSQVAATAPAGGQLPSKGWPATLEAAGDCGREVWVQSPHVAGSKCIAAFLLQTKTEAFCWQDPEGKKQNLPSVWLKITSKGLVSVFSGSGSIPIPDRYLLKQCQAASEESDRQGKKTTRTMRYCRFPVLICVRTLSLSPHQRRSWQVGTCLRIRTTSELLFQKCSSFRPQGIPRTGDKDPLFAHNSMQKEPHKIRGKAPLPYQTFLGHT